MIKKTIGGIIPIFTAVFIPASAGAADLMLAQEYKDQEIAGWAAYFLKKEYWKDVH